MALLVHVDDIVLAGNDTSACSQFKEYLHACFSIKDLVSLIYFLGLEVAYRPKGLLLSQCKYALEIVDESGLLGAKLCAFPMEENHNLALATGPVLDDTTRYRRLVGRLIYLTITCPDLCYLVHILYQFMQAPPEEYMNVAYRVLRHIKCTPDCGILLHTHNDLTFIDYHDSDWGAYPLSRHSLTGYLVTLGGSPISWKTKKQATVSRSSIEAKYRSMAAPPVSWSG